MVYRICSNHSNSIRPWARSDLGVEPDVFLRMSVPNVTGHPLTRIRYPYLDLRLPGSDA